MQPILPKCAGNNECSFVCTTIDCSESTFMCQNEKCECYATHSKCSSKQNLKEIREKLQEKGKGTEKTMVKFHIIQKLYERIMAKIYLDSSEMKNKQSSMGLEQHEFQFEQVVKGLKTTKITGDSTASVIESLRNFPTSIFEQMSGEQIYIKKIETQLEESLLNLRTLWKFRIEHTYPAELNLEMQRFKQSERALKEVIANKTYWLEINGKQEQNYNNISDLKLVTGIGFSECNINILKLLGIHCKALKNLGVRPDIQKFGDAEAEEIANGFRNLTRLTLHNHNITNQGVIKIAENLKSLEVLVIYGNKLTAEGEEKLSNMLPRCTKLLTGEPS